MAKVDPRQPIQKRRTSEELYAALNAFMFGKQQTCIPPQDDDDDIVLRDCIEELLQSRQLLTEMRNFAQIWLAKAPKR